MAIPSTSQTPHPLTEPILLNPTEQAIRRNTIETTPIDDFRRFSETNHEPKGVEPVNHGLPGPSQVTYHSHSGSFPAVESYWVSQRVHDPSRQSALLLAENGNVDL